MGLIWYKKRDTTNRNSNADLKKGGFQELISKVNNLNHEILSKCILAFHIPEHNTWLYSYQMFFSEM